MDQHVLADIIHKAPGILACCGSESKAALMACSKQLRSVLHGHITVVKVNKLLDIVSLCQGDWPSLTLVHSSTNLTEMSATSKQSIVQSFWEKLELVASLFLSGDSTDQEVFIVRSYQHCNSLIFPPSELPRALGSCLHCTEYHKYTSVRLVHSNLSSADAAQLLQLPWQHLESLDVSQASLDTMAITALTTAPHPNLQVLNNSLHRLDTAAMTQLAQAEWPLLRRLCLSGNPTADPAEVASFAANWPKLRQLAIFHVKLTAACIRQLTDRCSGTLSGSERSWHDHQVADSAQPAVLGGLVYARSGLK